MIRVGDDAHAVLPKQAVHRKETDIGWGKGNALGSLPPGRTLGGRAVLGGIKAKQSSWRSPREFCGKRGDQASRVVTVLTANEIRTTLLLPRFLGDPARINLLP